MKIDKRIKILIGGGVLIIIICLIAFLYKQLNNNKVLKLKLEEVSNNYEVNDFDIMYLYYKFHGEDGLRFNIIGNDGIKDNDYALYYQKKEVKFKNFSNKLKNFILLDTFNFQFYEYDEERGCYLVFLEEYKDAYLKNYGSLDDFDLSDVKEMEIIDDKVCIYQREMELGSNFKHTIDTYFVNGVKQDNKIIIYERVAFINKTDKAIEFYSDSGMKNKVYSLDINDIDISFINNSKIVSNVLLNYQDKFLIYRYTYVLGDRGYYFESVGL